jgi:hypothetical protein
MAGTGEIKTRGGPKLALLPVSLILAYQGLEEENLDQKSPGPPGWGVDAAGQPPSSSIKRKLLKSPLKAYILLTPHKNYVHGVINKYNIQL